jgi:hypothetical protein
LRFENLQNADDAPEGENRYFLLSESNPIEQTAGQLMVFFEWRPLTDKKKEALGKISQQRVGLVVLTTQFEPLICVCAHQGTHTQSSKILVGIWRQTYRSGLLGNETCDRLSMYYGFFPN